MSTADTRARPCPPPPPYEGSLRRDELLAYRTSIDSRITPGRAYRVRPTDRATRLFAGLPVRLVEIRPAAYCFRLTFDVPERTEGVDSTDVRSRCIYTDSWQPAAIALSPVGEERFRLKRG